MPGPILFSAKFKMVDDALVLLNFESLEAFEIICDFMIEDEDNVAFGPSHVTCEGIETT